MVHIDEIMQFGQVKPIRISFVDESIQVIQIFIIGEDTLIYEINNPATVLVDFSEQKNYIFELFLFSKVLKIKNVRNDIDSISIEFKHNSFEHCVYAIDRRNPLMGQSSWKNECEHKITVLNGDKALKVVDDDALKIYGKRPHQK